jgi:hypothetical protein
MTIGNSTKKVIQAARDARIALYREHAQLIVRIEDHARQADAAYQELCAAINQPSHHASLYEEAMSRVHHRLDDEAWEQTRGEKP